MYSKIAEASSEIMVIHDKIAPEMIPADIMGMVILQNVLILLAPSDRAASSIVMGICCKVATLERIPLMHDAKG